MTKILWKQSKKTGNERVENPPHLAQFENAEVVFEPQAPLFLEPFDQCAALGRLAVMDSNRLKMLGKVKSTVLKEHHAVKKGEHFKGEVDIPSQENPVPVNAVSHILELTSE